MGGMDELITLHELHLRGWTRRRIQAAEADGSLVRIRRGAWTEPGGASPRATHLVALRAAMAASHADCVASHVSAAVVHGLPLRGDLSKVWLTRPATSGGRVRSGVHHVRAPLPDDQVVEVDGIPVTRLDRTVVDLARVRDHVEAVMVADAALHRGLDPVALQALLDGMRRWPGVARARRVVEVADGRAESPYESWVRVLLGRMGLPAPLVQHEVRTPDGRFVARVDLAFDQWRLAVEYDGQDKYDRLAAPGMAPGAVFAREKERDRALRACGWEVLHLSKQDVHDWRRFQSVVHTAIAQARRRMSLAA